MKAFYVLINCYSTYPRRAILCSLLSRKAVISTNSFQARVFGFQESACVFTLTRLMAVYLYINIRIFYEISRSLRDI